jgi:cytochrome c oxidase subunit 3
LAKKSIKKTNKVLQRCFSLSTLALGILFVVLFVGFGQIVSNGYYFTGSESQLPQFLYIVTIVHLMHLLVD